MSGPCGLVAQARFPFSIMTKVPLDDIRRKLNPHFLWCYQQRQGSLPDEVAVKTVPALDLLFHPARFDLMIKYLYVRFHLRGEHIPFVDGLYARHLLGPDGQHAEADGRKVSLNDYVYQFERLISSLQLRGYDRRISVVPVNLDGSCLDGAHRLAASAYLGETLPVAVFDHPDQDLSLSHFRSRRILLEDEIDWVLLHYCVLNTNAYIVNVRHLADLVADEDIETILGRYGRVYGKKEIAFTFEGTVLREYLFYRNEEWIGGPRDGFSGARLRAEAFGAGRLRIFVFECPRFEDVLAAKESIRSLCGLGNDSVHVTDTREETIALAQMYFNANTLHRTNRCGTHSEQEFLRLLQSFTHFIDSNGIPREDVVIDGSSVMALYGLRRVGDIDFLQSGRVPSPPANELFDNHVSQLRYHPVSKNELIYDPRYHLYFEGMKFISLSVLNQMKRNRAERPKDIDDVALIARVLGPERPTAQRPRYRLRFNEMASRARGRVRQILVRLMPEGTRRRRLARRLNAIRRSAVWSVVNWRVVYYRVTPGDPKSIEYGGCRLFFTRGTSIVERYLEYGSFEPEVNQALRAVLDSLSVPRVLLDIGANIGMISLPLARRYPDLVVHAFEPGPHQAALLQRSISENRLDDRVFLERVALGDRCGENLFAVHSTVHASGDGLIDTGRAGPSQLIRVQMWTLDNWWERKKRPVVHLVKIDVEGAELLVLKGARSFLSQARPVVVFELAKENVAAYPYEPGEIIEYFEGFGYEVRNLDLCPLGGNQRNQILAGNFSGDLLALPRISPLA